MLLAFFLMMLCLKLSGGESCFEQVAVQQIGAERASQERQIIVPRASFTCNGRITGITASMDRNNGGVNDPYVEVWHPITPGSDVFDKVGEVQLVESKVVEEVDNNNKTYWLINITLNDDDRIEFETGDVIGFYHPPDSRYGVWAIKTTGYTAFFYILSTPSRTIYLEKSDISQANTQPLMQFTVDIQCDILSTPFNGGMSCSSGRGGVGYEGDTCSFTCNTGYGLAGSDTRTCQSDGSWSGSKTVCKQGCLANVNVYQGGDDQLRVDRQVIIPYVNCSNSDGRITHITASLSLNNNASEYPSFQVWRPMSDDPSVYERIGDEIVLEDSEVRAMDGYWLAEIVVSDNERIEFKSGDVIGCYHPSNVRYQVNTISGNGSSVHDCDGGNMTIVIASGDDANTVSVNTNSGDCIANPQQPLIQVLFDIRCDILSTPSNGGMSCSSGRVGVGYEGDTCSFTCNTGYKLTGSGKSTTCQRNGSWSGNHIVCTGRETCFESAIVQQRGDCSTRHPSQAVIPRANFTCNGRITGITASMERLTNGINDPYLQVWHPTTPDKDVFDKVGEVQLVESEVVEEVDNNNNTYWLVNITLSDDDRIEFEAEDVIGFYHPPDSRYQVWTIETPGYTGFGNLSDNSSNTIDLATVEGHFDKVQPLIEFTIDIRCVNLSIPSNGEMSCSFGRVGVGYEGDTCSFTCNTGYELTGSDNRTCRSNGNWSGDDTACRRVTCPSIVHPVNGMINCSLGDDGVHSYEDTCCFTCNTGYELIGSDNRTCQSNGSWSGNGTKCIESNSGDDNSTDTITAAAVIASLFLLMVLSFISICIIVVLVKKRRKYSFRNAAQHQGLHAGNPFENIPTTAIKEGDNVLYNPVAVRNYEMSAVYNELSSPIPNDYTEPLFDNGANLEPDGDGYSVPYDGMVVRKPYQQDAKSGNYQQRSQSFVQPATNLNLLLAQIKESLVMEISSDRICTIKELGYGEFGVVTLATWTDDNTSKEVAVKTLNQRASQKDKIKFFQEAALMAQFIHDNVIRMYGMVTKDPAMIVLEFAKKGDLREYLVSLQPDKPDM
ncbi:CUB and sushi domain-containing protein 1-like isoform X2 [Dysidea avara]|uniref:CUB and sushi domain-containing protein 1-like isoform X2 n=1 Tax=Dysidea avara TaxID=196820 RepID=UPI00332BCB6A